MEWKTIDSAPKDGTDVLVAMGYGMPPKVAGFFVDGQYGDGWYTFEQPENRIQPTHWMPLPPPPTE